MKIRVRSSNTVEDFHANKKRKFLIRLTGKSQKVRKDQLALLNGNGHSNGSESLALNKSGNNRGLHMREVPLEESSARMKKIRAMRRFYNKQMPVQQCNGCAYSSQCPQYKAGYECAFLPYMNSHKVDSVQDLIAYMREMVSANMRRTHWALTAETLSGGAPSLENSEAISMAFNQLLQLHEISSKDDDTLELEVDGGIIGQIFGGLRNLIQDTKLANAKPIEVAPTIKNLPSRDDILALTDSSSSTDVNNELLQEYARGQLLGRTKPKEPEVTEVQVTTVK